MNPDSLLQFLKDSGLSFKMGGRSFVLACPRCNKSKLYIRRSDGRTICFICDGKGEARLGLVEVLAALLQRPASEIQGLLYGDQETPHTPQLEINFKDFLNDDDDAIVEPELPTFQFPYNYYPIDHPSSVRGADYLRGRGIPLVVAKAYDLRYCPPERRVIFPVQSQGRLYGWQKRLIIADSYEIDGKTVKVPKILSSTGIPRDRCLMFADRLVGSEHAILCEGPVDAIKCHLAGGAVATLGKIVTTKQLEILYRAKIRKLYLALDPDAAQEMNHLVRQLSGDFELYEMVAPKKDLGDCTLQEAYDLFIEAPRIKVGRLFFYFKNLF